ncbi:MAG: hypothetical protein NTZ72_03335, partial [Afipia sp.]|nr:hypothetical protein [Afipia sp.]
MRAPAPANGFARWLAVYLPPSLGTNERPVYRDVLVFGVALFGLTAIAYVATISWGGTIPRDGTS